MVQCYSSPLCAVTVVTKLNEACFCHLFSVSLKKKEREQLKSRIYNPKCKNMMLNG